MLNPETDTEKGHFYRSDHFEFAKAGCLPSTPTPASISSTGRPFQGAPGRDTVAENYHKVTDVINRQLVGPEGSGGRRVLPDGIKVAEAAWPAWKPGCEFKARRGMR